MTDSPDAPPRTEQPAAPDATPAPSRPPAAAPRQRPRRGAPPSREQVAAAQPVLEQLFALYPKLFGARFLPLKLGVYDDLLARHPGVFDPAVLKVAMGLHARSTRYLESVLAGHPRHDLEGHPVEPVAPEHLYHAIVELYRRRVARGKQPAEALRAQTVERLASAIEDSGLDRIGYQELVGTTQPEALALLDDAFAEAGRRTARQEALRRAYAASGKSEAEFAEMVGIGLKEIRRLLRQDKRANAADEP